MKKYKLSSSIYRHRCNISLLNWLRKLFHKLMEILITVKSPVFDLLTYYMQLLAYFNLKFRFKLMCKTK